MQSPERLKQTERDTLGKLEQSYADLGTRVQEFLRQQGEQRDYIHTLYRRLIPLSQVGQYVV
jgi:hypothetical protein